MKNCRKSTLTILGLISITVLLRIFCLEHGISSHPDERHIIMVTERLSLRDMNPHSFAYGSLLFYLLKGTSSLLSIWTPRVTGYENLFIVGRCINALFAGLTVLVTYALGLQLFARREIALLGAFLLGTNTFFLQLSHFYVSDVPLTLFCLIAIFWSVKIAQRGYIRDYLLFGFFGGVALAFKVAALSLFIPLSCAQLALWVGLARSNGLTIAYFLRCLALLFAATLLFFITLFICAPFSILDWPAFTKDLNEQLTMVSGKRIPPYTRQYQFTPPFIYHIMQMGTSNALGWPMLLCAAAGIILALGGKMSLKDRLCRFLPVLPWLVLVFLSIAGKQVKFPRYLLPLYPLLILFGASFIIRLREALQKQTSTLRSSTVLDSSTVLAWLPVVLIVLSTIFPTLGLLGIYSHEHTYKIASRWVYDHIPQGATIVGVHWDDKVPVDLPNHSSHQYQMWDHDQELPLYEEDNDAKMNLVYQRFAKADYIIFPTDRLPGSILHAESIFPLTSNFIRLLYTEKLGFKLVQTIKLTPTCAGLRFPDSVNDESFTVYDHPRVSIFKRTEEVTAARFHELVYQPPLQSPTQSEVLRMSVGNDMVNNDLESPFGRVLLWMVLWEGLGIIALPLILYARPSSVDRSMHFSRPLGILVFGLSCWLLNTGGVESSPMTIRLLFLIFLATAVGLLFFTPLSENLPNPVRYLKRSNVWFIFFLFFLGIRCLTPEIYWGEKPMDFTFLNYLSRTTTLPPDDPWAVHHKMSYYYYGLYLCAILHKLSGIETASIFNLCIATIGALIATTIFGCFVQLTQSRRFAWIAVAIVACSANFQMTALVINEFFNPSPSNGFDLFWASTRVFPPYGFSEYPLWSILFADLHAHVIALPFTILFLGFLFEMGTPLQNTVQRVTHRCILGVILGSLFLLNIWDFLTYSTLFVVLNLVAIITMIRRLEKSDHPTITDQILKGAIDFIVPLVIAGLIVTIYNLSTPAPPPVGWGWIYREELLPFDSYWRMFGIQLVILMASLLIACSPRILMSSKIRLTIAIASAMLVFTIPIIRVAVVMIATTLHLHGINGAPESSYPVLVYCLSAILVFSAIVIERYNGILATLLIVSAGIFCGVETIYIIDRMNTIFKFFNAQWFILSFATCIALFQALVVTKEQNRLPILHGVLYGVIGIAVLTGLFGGICDVITMTSFHRVDGQRPSLNGAAFLEETKSEDFRIIRFLNEYTSAPERRTLPILEAYGNSYAEFTRIAMYTGLPTLIGWDHHVKQRGLSESELQRRKEAVRTIYATTNAEEAHRLLRENRIALVVIGPLEFQTYPTAGLAKFQNFSRGFKRIYKDGGYGVFEVLP